MSDYNILTDAVKEVGGETNLARCINQAKSEYQHIKELLIKAKENEKNNKEEKKVTVEGVAEGVKQDMIDGQRPTMGDNYTR